MLVKASNPGEKHIQKTEEWEKDLAIRDAILFFRNRVG